MYKRIPDSLEDALTIIKATLGDQAMATAAGVGTELLKKWMNPNHQSRPSWEQMVLLDVACHNKNGQQPIRAAFDRLTKYTGNHAAAAMKSLNNEVMEVGVASGALLESVLAANRKHSEHGTAMSPNEAIHVMEGVRRVEDEVLDVKRAVAPLCATTQDGGRA